MTVGAVAFLALPAPNIVEVPLQVAQDHEIQQSIVVQIDPSRTGGPAVASDSSFVSNVGERPVTVVVIKLVAGIRGHVQIFEAVIVVIADLYETANAGNKLYHNNRSEEHTSELQSRRDLVCRLLLEKKKKK